MIQPLQICFKQYDFHHGLIGDVVGKGLPAALVMANLHAALRTTVHFCEDPSEAMSYVNQHVRQHSPEGTFVTLILGIFNPETNVLDYVNAGHLLPFLVTPGAVSELGNPENPPLGITKTAFKEDSIVLEPNSGILVFTDGITETTSPASEILGVSGVLAAVSEQVSDYSSQSIVDTVVEAAEDFRESLPQQDDVTVLALLNRSSAPSARPDKTLLNIK